MSFLRRNLSCFYCGTSTGRKWHSGLDRFTCVHCEATNYLDDNGDITEPPVNFDQPDVTGSKFNISFSQTFSSPPPELSVDSSSIWCRTCLHNQKFYAESLASYLPQPNHPQYREYERNLPQYEKDLEERYPQVCANCVTKANARLRAATYAASTDHLRRGTLKTRVQGVTNVPYLHWKRLALNVACWMFYVGLILQTLWHMVGLLPRKDSVMPSLGESTRTSFLHCGSRVLRFRTLSDDCETIFSKYAYLGLLLNGATAWWHPKLGVYLASSNCILTDYGGFAIMQIVSLVVRAFVYWILREPSHSKLLRKSAIPPEAVHGFTLALIVVTTLVNRSTVKLKRRINFPFNEPLPEITVSSKSQGQSIDSDRSLTTTGPSNFPLSNLDPMSAFPKQASDDYSDLRYLESKANTMYDSDSQPDQSTIAPSVTTASGWTENRMDWEPTTTAMTTSSAFHPNPVRPLRPLPPPQSTGPSPFRGTLPPAPEGPAARLRKPKPAAFQPASEMRKENFFKGLSSAFGQYESKDTVDDGSAGLRKLRSGGGGAGGRAFQLGEQKLHLPQRDEKTGLEDLFGQSFKIKDNASAILDQRATGTDGDDDGGRTGIDPAAAGNSNVTTQHGIATVQTPVFVLVVIAVFSLGMAFLSLWMASEPLQEAVLGAWSWIIR